MNTNQFSTRQSTGWLLVASVLWSTGVFANNVDNFNNNTMDTLKWGADVTSGTGVLTQKNQRLEYTCTSLLQSDANRPWVLTRMPCNSDWTLQFDTFNGTVPNQYLQVSSVGLMILSPLTGASSLYVELYASSFAGLPKINGFNATLETASTDIGSADTGDLGATNGAVRMAFNSTNKVVTVYHDANVANGYQWVEFGSFGLAGAGGTTANTDWGLAGTNQFPVYVYGYSAAMTVTNGRMYGDNFRETGGATPTGGPSPVPVGNYTFGFPTNNPLLTAIASITGHYTGQWTVVANSRTYNVDVAQDDSGKVVTMGTLTGISNSRGGSTLTGPPGSVATVHNEPTARWNGSFNGHMDGAPLSLSIAVASPLVVTNIGGGTNSLTGTGNFSGRAAGVPFRWRDVPISPPTTPSMEANLKKDWALALDIHQKLISGKPQTMASARLVLPNDDTIIYPEKTIKYSATKGYTLSFTVGTNTTLNPPKLDKKTSLAIKNLTFVQSGSTWQPTGGTITYKFLGQQGTAALMDLVVP